MADARARPVDLAEERAERLDLRLPRIDVGRVLSYGVLLLGAAISLVPFLWMISTSLMSLGEATGGRLVPSVLHFENYFEAWTTAKFSTYLINSLLITGIPLAGELGVSMMAACAVARLEFA